MNKNATSTLLHTCKTFVPSPVSSLQIQENKSVYGSCKSVKFVNDVYLLFNQERLDRMSLERFSVYLNEIQSLSPSFSNLRSKVSDSDLQKYVKSRYIQSKSELLAWSNYLISEADNLQQDVADYIKSQSAQSADKSDESGDSSSSTSE